MSRVESGCSVLDCLDGSWDLLLLFYVFFSFPVFLILYNIHMSGMSLLYYTKNSSFLSSMLYFCQVYTITMGLGSTCPGGPYIL